MLVSIVALMLAPTDMRDAAIHIQSQQPLIELVSCSTRALASVGKATAVPIEGGSAVDFNIKNLLGPDGKALATFEFKDVGEARTIDVFYRHPFSAKGLVGLTKSLAKRCFKDEFDSWKAQSDQS